MALPTVGPISFNMIAVELGLPANTRLSLGQAELRTLAGIASGPINLSNFLGKSNSAGGQIRVVTGTGVEAFEVWGYQAPPGETFGSVTPTSIQGKPISALASLAGFVDMFYMYLGDKTQINATKLLIKDEAGRLLVTFPFSGSTFFTSEDASGRSYAWTPAGGKWMGSVGSIRYIDFE